MIRTEKEWKMVCGDEREKDRGKQSEALLRGLNGFFSLFLLGGCKSSGGVNTAGAREV